GGNQIRWPMRYWQQENSDNELVNATDPSYEHSSINRQLFAKRYPHIKRQLYCGSNDSFWAYRRENGALVHAHNSPQTHGRTYTDLGIPQMSEVYQDHLRVRIPFNYVKIQDQQRRSLSFRFLATPRIGQGAGGNRRDVAIASVMPGRYAVLGSAGTAYHSPE